MDCFNVEAGDSLDLDNSNDIQSYIVPRTKELKMGGGDCQVFILETF